MTEDARLREVERKQAVHEAVCEQRQIQILATINAMRDDGQRRDAKLRSIQAGVWGVFAMLAGLGGGTLFPGLVTGLQRVLGQG